MLNLLLLCILKHDSKKDIKQVNIFENAALLQFTQILLKIHAIFSHFALCGVIKDTIQYHSFLLLSADHCEVCSALEFKMSSIQT